ncbi:MAG: serine hydrolase [Bacteroidota bacterium]
MKNILFISLCILCFALPNSLQCQVIELEAVIKDQETGIPLPFASIANTANFRGTLSNDKGRFRLLISKDDLKDTLRISYVGYRSFFVPLNEAISLKEFELQAEIAELEEVEILGRSARSIIEEVLKRADENYFATPYKSQGFYRVTSRKDQQFIHLSEAVFTLHNDHKEEQFRLDKLRALKDERASQGLDLGLRSESVHEFDFMNHLDGFDLLNKKGLALHEFKYLGSLNLDGIEYWKIQFDQKEGTKKAGYTGEFLIEKETFAIVQAKLALSEKGIEYYKYGDPATRALMGILDIHIDMTKDVYQIEYRKIGQRYYLKSARNDARLHFQSNRDHYDFIADTRVDYVVTGMDFTNSSPFEKGEYIRSKALIEEQSADFDPEFWKDFIVILPDEDFQEIALKIEANNQANDLKLQMEERLQKLPRSLSLRIDSILNFYNAKDLFNGVALIQKGDSTFLHKAFNNRYTQNSLGSQYRIGSTAKTFTSAIIMQLVEEGSLRLDDSLSIYLPEYVHGDLSIRQLLSHTAGLDEVLENKKHLLKILIQEYDLAEMVLRFCSDSLIHVPGSHFDYANTGFIILAHLIEEVTGLSMGENLNQRIFSPLQMKQSHLGLPSNISKVRSGFLYGQYEQTYPMQNIYGAGGVHSTAEDLLKWSKAMQEKKIVSDSFHTEMLKPHAAYSDWDASYALGWMIDEHYFGASKEHNIIYHPGTDFGFYTMFLIQPEEEITIILLNNTGEFPRYEMTDLILKELN